ncbi:MAG: ASKHA domain-containing protein [PVC group bacterium]
MNPHNVTFLPSGKKVEVADGTTVLAAAARAGVHINSVCGGEGTCGKCRVIVTVGEVTSSPSAGLSEEEAGQGYVLACQADIHSNCTVRVPPESAVLQTAEGRRETCDRFKDAGEADPAGAGFAFQPLVRNISLRLPPPSLEDHVDDLSRLIRGIRNKTGIETPAAPLPVLKELPGLLRDSGWELTATLADRGNTAEILRLYRGAAGEDTCGVAVDIGTTTVVAHLVDLNTGRTLDAAASYNSQIIFGEDVIKRIIRSEEDGTGPLADAVRQDINSLIEKLCLQTGREPDSIYALICAGNSTMISLFLGITPRNIRREPYIPPLTDPPFLRAGECGIRIRKNAPLYCVPGIAGWVGGDITAGVLASGLDRSDALSLFIDIGTNGEIVVGNREWRLACSCSAGPAFEGSGISSGSRAVAGAIDTVNVQDTGTVEFRTIGRRTPAGICGSGLLDLVSELFRTGLLGRDGRFNPGGRSDRIRRTDGEISFVVVPADKTATGREISISQADIDNLIRAKAAVYAGILVLLKAVDLGLNHIEKIYVSGGFGNHLNIGRAICIGLLPDISREKITFIGNGSVRGAKMILLSREARKQACRIASSTTYFELSADHAFMDEYTRAMFLPHTDVENFPRCKKK